VIQKFVPSITLYVHPHSIQSQEAALWALASLAKDNVTVATALVRNTTACKFPSSYVIPTATHVTFLVPSTLPLIVSLAKARSPDAQLAACFWYVSSHFHTSSHQSKILLRSIANILRAAPSPSSSTYPFHITHTLPHSHSHPGSTPVSTSSPHSLHHSHPDHTGMDPETCARTVMSVVNRMIADDYSSTERNRTFISDVTQSGLRDETTEQREARRIAVKACFILCKVPHLLIDYPS